MLIRKMLRDIASNKMAYLACTMVIMIGLITYTAIQMARDNLFTARDEFYEEFHLAEGFARVKAMPYHEVEKLREIPGIEVVQGRLVKDVRVLGLAQDKNIYLRLISLNDQRPYPLNGVKLLRGSFPGEKDRGILLADKFFTAHGLNLGETVTVIIEGRKVDLTITGTGQSPEYVYAIRDSGNIFPDPQAFEVAYMPYVVMENLFNQKGMINDITFTLQPGYKFEDVEQELKTDLEKYGLESLISRKDQPSNAMLEEELKGLAKTSTSVPLLFLSIAAIILYIMLKRLVESQRGQIGTLKAFGYRPGEILRHYLSYGLLVGLVGGILGGLLGAGLSMFMTKIYQEYFSLPDLTGKFSVKYFFSGISLSVVFSLAAAFQGAKSILKLSPVEALRPPVPAFSRKSWLERIPGFWAAFTVPGRMAVRNMVRNKGRSFFTFVGIVFTFSLMAAIWSMYGLMDMMVLDQFTKVQKYDLKITFTHPLPLDEVARELERAEGVKRVEPVLEVPVTLQNQYRKTKVIALGLMPGGELYTPVDKRGNRIQIPGDGLLLSEQVARKLKAGVGDNLSLTSMWARESPVHVQVMGVIPQYLGANVYMNREALLKLLNQDSIATAALVSMDKEQIPALKEKYSTSKYINTLEERQQTIDLYEKLMATSKYTIGIMALLAVFTGFAIVYNSSIITLAERKRELASLRVLGMRPGEVLEVISVEQWVIGICGILAGIPLAYAMNKGIASSMGSDLYTLPAVTTPEALILAFLGTTLSIWLAQRWVARKVESLDLVEVLKERE
ncbi:FtsX-like permease family protein [Moorellaceae bacterium AZ2]